MGHRPFGALRRGGGRVHVGARRGDRRPVAHFPVKDFERIHGVFHGQQPVNFFVVQKQRHGFLKL